MSTPVFYMIAGPNGSGKTTLTDFLRDEYADLGFYINADEIARQIKEPDAQVRNSKAQQIAFAHCATYTQQKVTFSFETVMSHPSKLDMLRVARANGFTTILTFVGTRDPAINVGRVRTRVRKGGHSVPEDRIVARWFRTMGHLADAIKLSDHATVYDNSEKTGHKLVFKWKDGRVADNTPRPVIPWVQDYIYNKL